MHAWLHQLASCSYADRRCSFYCLQHFNLMYAYNAMASYYARDNVALLGFAKVTAARLSCVFYQSCLHITSFKDASMEVSG